MKHLKDRYLGSPIDYEIMIRELYKTSYEKQLERIEKGERERQLKLKNRRKITP